MSSAAAQDQLLAEATQLAARLVKLLNQLKRCNGDAAYSIASAFQAFLEMDEKELDFSFPSPPSQEIILEITR